MLESEDVRHIGHFAPGAIEQSHRIRAAWNGLYTGRAGGSLASAMNTSEFKNRSGYLKQLAATGEKIISQFRDHATKDLGNELKVQEQNSPYCLRVSFYGLWLLFRVELRFRESGAEGAVVAYWLSYDQVPVETPLNVKYAFDRDGNMRGGTQRGAALPYAECAPRFFSDVFAQLAMQDDAVLRP